MPATHRSFFSTVRFRLSCSAALLLAELFVFTIRFDPGRLRPVHTWWSEVLQRLPQVIQLILTVIAASLLVASGQIRNELNKVTRSRIALPAWPFLVAHLTTLATLVVVSIYVLDGDVRNANHPEAWLLLWCVLATFTSGLWAATALPTNYWLPVLRPCARRLLVGAAFGVVAWEAGQFTDKLWSPLASMTMSVSRGILSLFATEIVCDPDQLILGTPKFQVHISPSCSGYEGIGFLWAFLGIYLWIHRKESTWLAVLLVVPTATCVIWLFNAARIAALIGIGTWGSREVAVGGFHSQAGWLGFILVALGSVAIIHRFFMVSISTTSNQVESASAPWLLPLLVLIGAGMVSSAVSVGFDWMYPFRVSIVSAVLWHYRHSYSEKNCWAWSWFPVGIGTLCFGFWLALEPPLDPGVQQRMATSLAEASRREALTWLIFRVVGSVLIIPLAEEIAFRGYFTRRLIATDFSNVPLGSFTWASFFASSLAFGVLHGRWLAGTLAGMLFAMAFYRRGRWTDSALAHGIANALIALHVLLNDAWSYWE